jgi:hypothetical protein
VSRRWSRTVDGNQLRLEWRAARPAQNAERPPAESEPVATRPATVEPGTVTSPVLRLRWDFRTRFPHPTHEAIDAGLIEPEEAGPESVRAIHGAHAAELLGVLRDMDAEADARRGTGTAMVRADQAAEPSRLRRWYANLLGVYGDLFGPEAAEAFDQAVRAWHARVEVVVENGTDVPVSAPPPPSDPEPPPLPTVRVIEPPPKALALASAQTRVVARLPVPKPLPQAVDAGHFGHDEDGQPVRPSADEVREITEAHAELLADMVADLAEADRRGVGPTEVAQLHDAVRKYAEDFGDRAAEQLLAYARRQAASNHVPTPGRGR